MDRLIQNNRRTGNHYEGKACDYLENIGIQILDRNFRLRIGEIDIIAKDGDYICFVEVKFRRSLRYGRPAEAVTLSKQKTIRKAATCWLIKRKYTNIPVRFDVIEILGNNINYLKNAF